MLTAARLREYTGDSRVLDLLRDLGYPVHPVTVDAREWARGGIIIPADPPASLYLISRTRDLDLFLLRGEPDAERIERFLRETRAWNVLTKSALLVDRGARDAALFDLSETGRLRRLDLAFSSPGAQLVDRLNLLALDQDPVAEKRFARALDRESVTRKFFRRFRGAVDQVAEQLGVACPNEPADALAGESLLLLSRLLFLSFVQEKGWLSGERRYLGVRLERDVEAGREFFSETLLPLFFGCLNTAPAARNASARVLGRIPYLNGGLFEPSAFELRHPEIHLPNEILTSLILELFERFEFAVDETDAGVTQVDPEMLGKVFESLMAEGERAATGSFYTPKEIVDVLTGRAVEEWLQSAATDDPAALLDRLASIRILDPACGSGAFLLAALIAIERKWRELAEKAGRTVPADLRRRIVSNCLYGVDLKPEAVRLCELRLWLAIVTTSDEPIERVEPLPNLDRNILQGNSLVAPADFLGDSRLDLYARWSNALRSQSDLIERYRTAPAAERPALCRLMRGNDTRLAAELLAASADEHQRELDAAMKPQLDLFGGAIPIDRALCRALQRRVDEARLALDAVEEGALDFFSYDIHFAHVLSTGGFDVVVGNPPWVRNNRIAESARRMLSDRYALFRRSRSCEGFHQPDLAVAFFERAAQLISNEGVVALLMPAKVANAKYAEPLRRMVAEQFRVAAVWDWSDDPRRSSWFDADTFPLGFVAARPRNPSRIEVMSSGATFRIQQEEIGVDGFGSEWALAPAPVSAMLRRLRERFAPLSQVLSRRPFMGVKTGCNEAFFIEPAEIGTDAVVTSEGVRIPLSDLARCVRGRNVHRWTFTDPRWMIWPPMRGWRQIPPWLAQHAQVRGIETNAFRLAFVRPEHIGVKVVWKDLSRGVAAVVLPDRIVDAGVETPLVPNQTLYGLDAVGEDEAYALAALLNSTVAGALLVSVAERAKDRHYRYFGRTVAAMPVPPVDGIVGLARLGRRAQAGERVDAAIDREVALLYGLSSAEWEQLRSFLEGRVGARAVSA